VPNARTQAAVSNWSGKDGSFDLVAAELSAILNAGMERYTSFAVSGRGCRALSFSAETASLNLPHSYGIALRTTVRQDEGVHRKKS